MTCVWIDVQYDHVPVKDSCPQCGRLMYLYRTDFASRREAFRTQGGFMWGQYVKACYNPRQGLD